MSRRTCRVGKRVLWPPLVREQQLLLPCRSLAHLYHYYLHGEKGNVGGASQSSKPDTPHILMEGIVGGRQSGPATWQKRAVTWRAFTSRCGVTPFQQPAGL